MTQPTATAPMQLDLFSYTPAPAAPAPRRAAPGRSLPAARWIPVEIIRSSIAKADSHTIELVIDGQATEDGQPLVYRVGAPTMRRLFVDMPRTTQIRLSAATSERAVIVEMQTAGSAPNGRMLIRDGAWHRQPKAKTPAQHRRTELGDTAYTAAYDKAIQEYTKKVTNGTIRITVID